MNLIDALKKGKVVVVSFVDTKRKKQWSATFKFPNEIAEFFAPIVGTLTQAGEEYEFDYYKEIFISEDVPLSKIKNATTNDVNGVA